MGKKLKGRALSKFEAGRDVWQEVLDGVREIKSGGGKQSIMPIQLYDMEKLTGVTQVSGQPVLRKGS